MTLLTALQISAPQQQDMSGPGHVLLVAQAEHWLHLAPGDLAHA